MSAIGNIISTALGYIMYVCYYIVKNYGLAIILFTLLTKIVLLPISIWVHKNGIKIVRIMPEINNIKIHYFGDKDQISEKTADIYKREKYNPFASVIPLIIQLVLLVGLVSVIYNPMTHLLHVRTAVCEAFVEKTADLVELDPESSSRQMTVVDTVKNPGYSEQFLALQETFPQEDISGIISDIQGLNMSLFQISYAAIPAQKKGITLLVPLLAGLAAWILCMGQNSLNPLQAEQGVWNKLGTMLFSVGISLFLGAFVPIGVGFYWIFSNLFSLLQQVILNRIMDPHKFIDYEALEKSKEELRGLEEVGKSELNHADRRELLKREKDDYKRFFSIANKHFVIYSESSGFYKYYKDIIEWLIRHSNISIHYITNDPNDAIFIKSKECPQIKPYYIGEKKLITLMMKMDADIVLMTTPDLETYYLKRSYIRKDIEYIYTYHAFGSENLTLRTHALDYFDTILCTGPHNVQEQRALEALYGLKPKKLVEAGYCLIDDMDRNYSGMDKKENEVKTVLIAPSWQKDNILDLCLDEILSGILNRGYKIIVRPHPQYVKIYRAKWDKILDKYKDKVDENFILETDFSSNVTVYMADLVITDWSNIGYEFSFTTYKPTLYINTPMKIMNPEWEKIDITPINIKIRDQIGASLEVEDLNEVSAVVDRLIKETPAYYNIIAGYKQKVFFNLGKSGEVSGKYILNRLKERQKK